MRVANRILCAVLALALLAGGLVVAVEIVLAGLGRRPWLVPHDGWRNWATVTTWSARSARVLFAALVVVGLALLALELWRRRPPALPLASATGDVAAELDRRSMERWLADRVERVEGVSGAQAEAGAKVVHVRADSVGGDAGVVEQRVRDAVGRHLEELALARPLRVKVDVRSRRVS